MSLDAHVGREFPLALGGAVVADWTIEVLVTGVVRRLGGCVARFRDGAGVELPGAMRRSDEGSDDALQVLVHCIPTDETALAISDHCPVYVDAKLQ
jgi:hypothetical protein